MVRSTQSQSMRLILILASFMLCVISLVLLNSVQDNEQREEILPNGELSTSTTSKLRSFSPAASSEQSNESVLTWFAPDKFLRETQGALVSNRRTGDQIIKTMVLQGDDFTTSKKLKETLTKEEVRRINVGCFLKPEDFWTFAIPGPNAEFDTAKCFFYCERKGYVIAARDSNRSCYCGQFDSGFSLTKLGKPVNGSQCATPCEGKPSECVLSHVRIMRTNVKDNRCKSRNLFPRSIGRLVALISFPGSGNTWTRYLIETATGIYTGSVYHDPDLYKNGFFGELLPWNSRRTCVIKTHNFQQKDVAMFEEAVFLIRNPYDAIMAEFNRVRGGHIGYAEPELFRTMEWFYFVAYKISKWIKSIQNYSAMDKVLIVYFEDIVVDPMREVRRIVEFLGYPIINLEQRLTCLEINLNGNFKRPKRTLNFEAYSQRSKDAINAIIKEARTVFADRNLPSLPQYER